MQLNLLDVRPVFQNLTELRSLSIADITNMPLGLFVPLSNLLMLNISGTHLNNETLQILNPLGKLKVSKSCIHDVPEVDLAFTLISAFNDISTHTHAYIECVCIIHIHIHNVEDLFFIACAKTLYAQNKTFFVFRIIQLKFLGACIFCMHVKISRE